MSAQMPVAAEGGTDLSRLLALHTRGARVILGIFIVSNVLFTASTASQLDHAWASYLALVLVSVGGVLVSRPHPDPFAARLSIAVLAVVVVSTVLVSYALPDVGTLGRATWHLGANTWLLWFLILRRRVLAAWIGGVTMIGSTIVWGVLSGRGALFAVVLSSSQIGLLVIATLFGVALRRTAARINELAERSVRAAAASASVDVARDIRRQRVAELATTVVPLLERIASREDFTDADRREFARVEAHLRDSVRGRSLARPEVMAAVSRARARGVEVTLLDDRGQALPSGSVMATIEDAVATALDSAREGEVTVRLLPAGRDVAVTVVNRRGEETTRLALTDQGVVDASTRQSPVR